MTNKTSDTSDSGRSNEIEEERLRHRLLALERESEQLRSRVRLLGIGLLVTLILGAVGVFSQGVLGLGKDEVAVELLTAAQALDFRAPLQPGTGVKLAYQYLRGEIGHASEDYEVRNDLDICAGMLRAGNLATAVEQVQGPLN